LNRGDSVEAPVRRDAHHLLLIATPATTLTRVLAPGLSTNPSGSSVTADQLKAAITATHTLVDGYWLDIPAAGTAWPRCGQARPQVAIDRLRSLGR
jgi:hypothetical protein